MNHTDIILNELKKVADSLFGGKSGHVYLYGSRARGEASMGSDWDLLIVTDDPEIKWNDFERYAFPFSEIGWKYGEEIIPVLYTRKEWESQKDTLFYHNISKDAIQL